MTDHTSADDAPIVGPDRVRNVMAGLLRAAQHEGWTDKTLSEASGVCARRIKSYRTEGKEPALSAVLSLAVVLGPKFLNPLLATIGYAGRPLDEPDALQPTRIVAEGMKQFAVIAECAADGRIDHTEQPLCEQAADALIATVLPLSSTGRAA